MALAGVELETLVSDTDALTTRPPPCAVTILSERISSYRPPSKSNLYASQITASYACVVGVL